jgi:hypothetical protein
MRLIREHAIGCALNVRLIPRCSRHVLATSACRVKQYQWVSDRARPCQGRGQGFDPPHPLQEIKDLDDYQKKLCA